MIQIIPSLSVLGGKAVRLSQGNYDQKVVYTERPLEVAERFEEHGITRLHLIDLDGARTGNVANYDALEMIAHHTSLAIDFGGGISNDGVVAKAFEYGAKMVTVGSLAVTNPDLVAEWLVSYGRSKVILSADVDQGKIMVRGRQKGTDLDLFSFIEHFYEKSLCYVKCADNHHDGMMDGPNLALYKALLGQFPDLKLFASGGVGSLDDIKRLEDLGVYGVIVGKAIYEGRITLKQLEGHLAKMA
ncbi:MAG: 1-(5-phosphoribosyl)-5-[(5-phosphoribosylamino)methylideneamino] imidazole-4-carboxamide isomerase [Bernardetiaceae bacterium]|jgi:phosphoribosylformimino-5-aminoimidazole carboxamide ribotide isomerase|nr:1-(5-phosphoribosyl)-5-[(5-phosphoribosylamino)methylideneamino] imidazole-4-carboxamide isomerase [Bernardetiaceae bacterium]